MSPYQIVFKFLFCFLDTWYTVISLFTGIIGSVPIIENELKKIIFINKENVLLP